MKKLFVIMVVFVFYNVSAQISWDMSSFVADYESQVLNFDGSVYPSTSFSSFRQHAMKVWGELHDAQRSQEMRFHFYNDIDGLVEKILFLYVIGERLSNEKKSPEYFQEVRSLLKVVTSIEHLFDVVMADHRSDQASCVKVVLQKIQKKMEQTSA